MNYALVVGIQHYEEKPLNGAVGDAKRFANWLTEKGLVDNSPDKLHLLTSNIEDSVALDFHIDTAINKMIIDVKKYPRETNRLYFYFSGHGLGILHGRTALCMRNWSSQMPGSCISAEGHHEAFTFTGAFNEVISFLDCCRDKALLTNTKSPAFKHIRPEEEGHQAKAKSCLVFGASYGKSSFEVEIGKDEHDIPIMGGVFTKFIIEAMNGDALDREDGNLILNSGSIKSHLNNNFRSYALNLEKDQIGEFHGDVDLVIREFPNDIVEEIENYYLTFTRDRRIRVLDGVFKPTGYEGEYGQGVVLRMRLNPGVFQIIDELNNETKFITNYSSNTITNESF